jgi:type II secretory pathway pseudopilin PulG
METKELNEKPKFNWKRLLITIGIVIITAGAIGGSIYYVMNQQATKDKKTADKQAQDLQKQIDDLKKAQESKTNTTATPIATTQDETASWKTYTNQPYGFTIKYPADWILQDGLSVKLSKGNQAMFITPLNNSYKDNPTAWLNRNITWGNYKNVTNKQSFTAGSYTGLKFNNSNDSGTHQSYVFTTDKTSIELNIQPGYTNDSVLLAEKILSTITIP